MTFPTLSRRHVATRTKRRLHRNPKPTNAQKVSSPTMRKSARSESLRSTWMTNGSDSMDDQDQYLEETEAEAGQELQMFVQLQRPLSDWVYWQRDAIALPDCWTRVFAVFCGNLLWLYRYEDASAKSLLVRLRVTALDVGDSRQLHFRDATTAANVQLYMPDAPAFYRWHSHISTAVGKFPPVEEEKNQRELVPAVASAMQKKSFWKALATAVIKSSIREEVKDPGNVRKSLGERWKGVATALKLRKRQQVLQL